MDWDGPREMMTSTDSSSDDESSESVVSVDGNQIGTQMIPLANNTWNGEHSRSIKRVCLSLGFPSVHTTVKRSLVLESNTIISDEEFDESIPSSVFSVSPSDEEAYQQEINGDVTDNSSDGGRVSEKSKLDCKKKSNGSRELPVQATKSNPPKPIQGGRSVSKELLSALSPEMNAKIEEQKARSIEGFLDWKVELPQYFGNHFGLLSQVFRLNLNTLVKGEYWFGSDFIMDCNQDKAPKDATFVGLILSEGASEKKYLVITGRKKVELKEGYFEAITDILTIKVYDDGELALYNKGKPSFLKVCASPPDLFFNYDSDLIFVGIITSDKVFKVNVLGCDVEFQLDVFENECQVLYIDHLSKLQKIYPVRAVVLNVLSERLAMMDFNYSYACRSDGKYKPKLIDVLIPAGANPFYF
ncbi:hypothetical protein HK103_000704 [Boothiomyces macroporosus]|uniref:Uncharacterized protein n=1 Tax=Boothiomyces macroporosus TaxID=261099 RepID=A0AAD5Y111_9FUNG|nr:hypothetical protein HK103_000704 [Boothiomyces macroporosus]